MAECNSTLTLNGETIAHIREALLIGLASYGEIERLLAIRFPGSRMPYGCWAKLLAKTAAGCGSPSQNVLYRIVIVTLQSFASQVISPPFSIWRWPRSLRSPLALPGIVFPLLPSLPFSRLCDRAQLPQGLSLLPGQALQVRP